MKATKWMKRILKIVSSYYGIPFDFLDEDYFGPLWSIDTRSNCILTLAIRGTRSDGVSQPHGY